MPGTGERIVRPRRLEEDDPTAALTATGSRLAHVQLSDSNRLQPGAGHLDFGATFATLRAMGYHGWLALECRLRGEASQALPATASFLRRLL
jgi:sugar phosphate isomerase/epimerase